ncbi:uncharacterized protein LOC127011022 [Drosophila biarmipes]|uniref:uncharacterized protein LOC127011022 n=1 Tax=Drosophila biarmipes TaxID=125945 RepID=UPI0021CCDDC5|nr:uncharacterized protein LOC127011022 [Drosophila biarmipes]
MNDRTRWRRTDISQTFEPGLQAGQIRAATISRPKHLSVDEPTNNNYRSVGSDSSNKNKSYYGEFHFHLQPHPHPHPHLHLHLHLQLHLHPKLKQKLQMHALPSAAHLCGYWYMGISMDTSAAGGLDRIGSERIAYIRPK